MPPISNSSPKEMGPRILVGPINVVVPSTLSRPSGPVKSRLFWKVAGLMTSSNPSGPTSLPSKVDDPSRWVMRIGALVPATSKPFWKKAGPINSVCPIK